MQTNAILPVDVSGSFPVVICSAPQHIHFVQTHVVDMTGTMTVSRYIHLKLTILQYFLGVIFYKYILNETTLNICTKN